jgi:hypothetical protein
MKKRIQGISKATDRLAKEDVEQVDEISKSTAMSYIKKAYASDRNMADKQTAAQGKQDYKTGDAISKKRNLRQKGINRATKKMFGEACWSTHKQEGMKKKGGKMVPNCVPKEERSAQDPDIKDRKGTQPAAYHKGLKKSTKAKRDAHFKTHGPKPDNDASAYQDAPGDKAVRAKGMRKSKYTSFVDNMMKEEDSGFAEKSKKSGISVNTLRKVYNRGVAAWKTGHRPGTTPQQWGHARVNAFITKKKKGGLNHDKDLA